MMPTAIDYYCRTCDAPLADPETETHCEQPACESWLGTLQARRGYTCDDVHCANEDEDVYACPWCNRWFCADSLFRHQAVCTARGARR